MPSMREAVASASGPVFHDDDGIEGSDDGRPFDVVDLGVEIEPKRERVASNVEDGAEDLDEDRPFDVVDLGIEMEPAQQHVAEDLDEDTPFDVVDLGTEMVERPAGGGGNGGDDGNNVHSRQSSIASSTTVDPSVQATPGQETRRQSALSKLKKVTEDIKEGAFKNGFGFSSTTVSPVWNPFQSKVSSAKPKMGSFVGQEGVAPPKVPKTLLNAASRVGRSMPQEGAALQSLKKDSTINRAIANHFNGPANRKAALLASVMQLKEATGMSAGEATVLVKALASHNKDTAQAERILQALPQVRLMDDLLTPRAAGEITADVQLAWKFAAEIEGIKGGKGLDLLSKVTAKPDGAADGAPALTAAQRGPMRAYLRAAAEVARAAGRNAPALDPSSMFAHGKLRDAVRATPNGWPGRAGAPIANGASLTLAEKALLAVRDELDPTITEIHGCRFAVQMARGGMVTDKARNPDGTKSEFQKVESRASKTMGMHLNRAMASSTGFQRIADTLRYGTLHHGKSPFYGYDAIVSSRGQNMGFELSHIGGIHEGRAMKDMVDVLESTLKARGGAGDVALPTAQNAVDGQALLDDHGAGGTLLRNMVRSEILQRAKTEALLLPRLARGDNLSESAIAQVRTAVLAAIQLPESSSSDSAVADQVQELLTAALTEQNVPLTPARLLAWAGDAGGPTDAETVQEMRTFARQEGQPDWKSFSTAFDRAANQEVRVPPNTPIKGRSRAETAEILASMIRGEELGSGFSLANAGNTQATTRNVSEVISGVLSGATMSVRADLGGGRTRIVSFESGVSTDRSSLRMSVSTVRRNQEGAGGSLGFRLGKKEVASFSAFVGGDVGHSFELLEQDGAVFGFPRHKTGGVGGDRDLAQQKARLIKLLIGVPDEAGDYQAPGNKEDKGSLVKRAYQEFGDAISIGAFEVRQKDNRFTGSSSAGAGATIGNLRVGLPQESVAGEIRLGTLEYKDTSGTLKLIRESESNAFKATVTGALASLSGLIEGATAPTPAPGEAAVDAVTSMTSLAVANFGSIASDFFRDGETRTTSRILYDDQELPTSFATQTMVTSKDFVNNLAADVENFAEDKAKKFFPARHGADRDQAVQTEKKILGEFAGQLREHRDLTGTSQLYWEWSPSHVEASNLLEADRELSEKLGDTQGAKQAKRDIDAIHKDPGYREARFLINANEQSASDIRGVNGIMGVRHDVRTSANVRSLNFT